MEKRKAVILLSGGVDSTTVLAIAKEKGYACYALTVDYGQRHVGELRVARQLAEKWQTREHRIVTLDIDQWGGSALTDAKLSVPKERSDDIPITYVPARNTIFLSLALAWAEVLGAFDIFIGANVVDYSNYPDCRPAFLRAFANVAQLATRAGAEEEGEYAIHAPLLEMTKAEIIKTGTALGIDYAETLSCYSPTHEGLACRQCDACYFRAKGFSDAGLPDVTRYSVALDGV